MLNEKDQATLENEVLEILEQMGHSLHLGMIRRFAFVLSKIAKRIYGKVLVNKSGVDKIKEVVPETPILYLPTHRSYADFLLISYLAFHFDLPLPVIAAGMDFMSMAVVGDMLRGAGAFFIRRSFVDDVLYWAIFQEYVQILIKEDLSPMEFFLEGTRSRSGKSLPPKLGLLGCVTECWLRGSIPDLIVVPLTISYNRTLEEKLYAYELLGVPKPKESTSGLLKATSILKEDYGDIYINIGDPISIRKYLEPKVDRHLFTSKPLHLSPLTKQELCECESLGLHVLRKLQKGAVISVWSLSCISFMQSLWKECWAMPFLQLEKEVEWLVYLVDKLGAVVSIENSASETLKRNLNIHCLVASENDKGNVVVHKIHNTNPNQSKCVDYVGLNERTVEKAVSHLLLQHYINQAIHIFVRPALVTLSLLSLFGSTNTVFLDDLQERFYFLRKIFSNEFVFEKEQESQDFMDGLAVVTWSGETGLVQNKIHYVRPNKPILECFLSIIRPFILTYHSCATVAVS